MSMTLLEIVQNILSAMDSDEVNSISDTTESLQVATVVKETYEEQFNNITTPSLINLFRFEGLSALASPNYLKVPDDIDNFKWVKYKDDRNNGRFDPVDFVSPEEFLDRAYQYDSSSTNVFLTADPVTNVEYYVKNNASPKCYTVFNDQYLAFDSYDSTYDTTMQQIKSIGFGTKRSTFLLEDTFIPVLSNNLFPLLLAEAKAVCFINFKQISNVKEETKARRQRIRMQNDQFRGKTQQARHTSTETNYARNR